MTNDELAQLTQVVLNNPDGKRLLEYLNTKYYDNKFREEDLARQVGKRDVMQEINQLMKERV